MGIFTKLLKQVESLPSDQTAVARMLKEAEETGYIGRFKIVKRDKDKVIERSDTK